MEINPPESASKGLRRLPKHIPRILRKPASRMQICDMRVLVIVVLFIDAITTEVLSQVACLTVCLYTNHIGSIFDWLYAGYLHRNLIQENLCSAQNAMCNRLSMFMSMFIVFDFRVSPFSL